jgi:hypothetical protein
MVRKYFPDKYRGYLTQHAKKDCDDEASYNVQAIFLDTFFHSKTNGTCKFLEENISRKKFVTSFNPFQDRRTLKKG